MVYAITGYKITQLLMGISITHHGQFMYIAAVHMSRKGSARYDAK